jgi:hypothetical protein
MPQHFMESESSTPCSQELATDPYPEPDETTPQLPIYPYTFLGALSE